MIRALIIAGLVIGTALAAEVAGFVVLIIWLCRHVSVAWHP